MTLEEKAEEYKRQFYGVRSLFSFSDIEQAYLTGAKENGVIWHDLRKDPNDLPQKVEDERQISDTVWIHIDNWGTEEGYYDYSSKSWIVRCRVVNISVIAWCEIPQFNEK